MALKLSRSKLSLAAKPLTLRRGVNLMARPPLSFMDAGKNPITGLKGTPEEKAGQLVQQLDTGFGARAREEARRFAETTKTDYYIVLVFEHGDQTTSFLTQTGYPEVDATYVDGTILAERLKLRLPPSPFKLKKLRPVDKSLLALTAGKLNRSK